MLSQQQADCISQDPAAAGAARSYASTDRPSANHCEQQTEGGCPSNTHPQASQGMALDGFPEYRFSGGFDWLAWSASVAWNPAIFETLMRDLTAAKERCQAERKEFGWIELPEVGPISVYRTGVNYGGNAGWHFEFKLCFGSIEIGLAKSVAGTQRRPNLFVSLTGRDCLLLGAKEGYDIVNDFISRLGGAVEWEKLARGDLAMDISGLSARLLQELAEAGQFITSARIVNPHTNLIADSKTGLSVGRAPLRLAIYGKLEEAIRKCDALYLQCMIDRRWNGVLPCAATRIEFQGQRPWYRDRGVSTPTELFGAAGSVVKELTDSYFRFTDRPVDRKNNNQGRAEVLPLWKSIQKAFPDLFGLPGTPLVRIRREQVNPEQLFLQARGCIAAALHQMDISCGNTHDMVFATAQAFYRLMSDPEDEKRFFEEYRREQTRHAA